MYSLLLLLLGVASATNCTTLNSTARPAPLSLSPLAGWQVTFEDNFNALNKSRWKIANECSTEHGCAHNNEEQVYLASQVRVEDGNLVVEATNQPYTSPAAGTRQFRSGRLDSSGSFAQQFGRFEARIKLPVGRGMWPAFWLMPRGGRCWPTDGEIDIMEYVGQSPDQIHGNYHFGPSCNRNFHDDKAVCGKAGKSKQVALDKDFHVYAVEWTPTSISWFFDGQLYYVLTNAQCTDKAQFFIPQKAFYIILNVAVGGTWPGSPSASTVFPQRMLVDYVRVYKPGA
ncbi:hypothetical protein SPRG_07384 [Saprolegnia parasitica CBS 223.65]|uniref:GH16 domain-containing protein n=1 Tax=Saprolegnia parasitica (strain CBS 223.65) TaxID=695850 RepID=A0A067CF46_SAPPC|nr:hypothetical protein SPRG_07384 [Saprolegnia parasitica CBS 223.65]KDO27785.1 hypothetical protein SPRG_07384 [Saprolegnia parasitica CBS 223.65]|eukprot:XP_012201560.1 hypothetical protein SPRG_07384 [Saprolegnia parasitica CBS 223.65]